MGFGRGGTRQIPAICGDQISLIQLRNRISDWTTVALNSDNTINSNNNNNEYFYKL
jgi:hypothetical protein